MATSSQVLNNVSMTLKGMPFSQVQANGVAGYDVYYLYRSTPATAVGDTGGPPQPYQNTPVIVCVITG